MTTLLTTRQAIDHPFLLTLLSGAPAQQGRLLERVLAVAEARPEKTYEVEVRVNGVELDFAEFTDRVSEQFDELVVRAARKLLDEQLQGRVATVAEELGRAERAAKDLANAIEDEARKALDLPGRPED